MSRTFLLVLDIFDIFIGERLLTFRFGGRFTAFSFFEKKFESEFKLEFFIDFVLGPIVKHFIYCFLTASTGVPVLVVVIPLDFTRV
jgi:hypothetical protein